MLIPYSNNLDSFSYKTYKNNSDKIMKHELDKLAGGEPCKILDETTISRLKERDFTCFADPQTNDLINSILNFIYDNIIKYTQDPNQATKYKNMINGINNAAKRLANSSCNTNSNVLNNKDNINQLSSIMCNYLFVEHIKDLYFIPKYFSHIKEHYYNIEYYTKIGVFIDALTVFAAILTIFISFTK